jgi:hypothetical protein
MTSDAKIGLLLGLVFIFIIAFVINGLPRFRNVPNADAMQTPVVSVGNDSIDIAGTARHAQIDFGPSKTIDEQPKVADNTNNNSSNTENISSPMLSADNLNPDTSRIETPQSSSYESSDRHRFSIPIPLTSNPFMYQPYSPSVPVINVDVQNSRSSPSVTQDNPPAQSRPQQQQSNPQPLVQGQSYTVQEGDNLAKIAKSFYGQEEGNKRATIQQLYEANRDILKSVDSVVAGKKIVIPNLQHSQFTPVSSVGGGAAVGNTTNTVTSANTGTNTAIQGRVYVVKDKENLWKIASEQLGKPSRYSEIIKLNPDKLTEENILVKPGMQLKLPAQ